MERTPNVRRFRANPIEVAILSVSVLIFVESAYSLFYDTPDFHLAALSAMKSNPLSEERAVASLEEGSLQTLTLECGKRLEKDINNSRVRLTGQICGMNEAGGTDSFVQVKVIDSAHHQEATVFPDPQAGTFSTDYITLSEGKNPIRIEFSYGSGRSLFQDLVLTKLH